MKPQLLRTKLNVFIAGMALAAMLAATFIASVSSAATNDLTSVLQQGLFEEEANHNLDAAAQAYQTVSTQFDKDRKLAATAIFRLGEIYRKQGKTADAAAQYQRVIREFSDQGTLVTLSRQNLAGIGSGSVAKPNNADAGGVTLPSISGSYDRALVNRIKNLSPSEARQILPTLIPDQLLNNLLSQYNQKNFERAGMLKTYTTNHPQIRSADKVLKTIDGLIQDRIDGITKALELRVASGSPDDGDAAVITDEEEQEIRRIRAMIQNSPDLINAFTGNPSSTPLAAAAGKAQLRVAEFLLANGANVNLSRPLAIAAGGGHRGMVELLLRHGAAVDAADSSGETALHKAAARGFLSVMEVLLAAKADPNLKDDSARTPLTLAAEKGFISVATVLLGRGVDPNILATTRKGYARDRTLEGAPLHFAVMRGDDAMVVLLLTNRANVALRNSFLESPLDIAAMLGKTSIAARLIAAGADVNATGTATPLHHAVGKGATEIVRLLLEHGANPNVTTLAGQEGVTPLMMAASSGNAESVSLLLKHKADPNATDAKGTTVLLKALYSQNAETAKALLAGGADPLKANESGTPMLMVAASTRSKELVEAFLANGADVNVRNQIGETALFWAVRNRQRDLVEMLLELKADPNIRNNQGTTILSLAESKPDGLAALLRQHGAVDDLPDFSWIFIRRPGVLQRGVFRADTNGYNQFTVLETLRNFFPPSLQNPAPGAPSRRSLN